MGAGTIPDAVFDRLGGILLRALDGLSLEQLCKQPAGPESNPIGWITFHLTRVHDAAFSSLLGRTQIWVQEKWYETFGLSPDTRSMSGSSLPQVREFNPISAEVLAGYWQAARVHSQEFLKSMRDEDIEQVTPVPPAQTVSAETYRLTIARVTSDAAQHIGQVAYARGLVDRHGWYGA